MTVSLPAVIVIDDHSDLLPTIIKIDGKIFKVEA
jgi:hypothetical protein